MVHYNGPVPYSGPRSYDGLRIMKEKRQTFMLEVILFYFIFFLRTKGSKMKKRTKEEGIEENLVVHPDI